MIHRTFLSGMGMLALILSSCADDTTTTSIERGVAVRPEGADPKSTVMPDKSIYLFEDAAFRGDVVRIENVTSQAHETHHVVPQADRMSSARWDLPRGALVLLYEHAGAKGEQMPIWGEGEVASMSDWRFNDKVSRWAWYNLGGSGSPTTPISARPPGADATSDLPVGAIEVFEDVSLRGTMVTIGPMRDQPQGIRHGLENAHDRMSSLRWNLPPGVVVIFYEDAGGKGRQLPIWGSGQYQHLNDHNFNDLASRWAWFDVAGARN